MKFRATKPSFDRTDVFAGSAPAAINAPRRAPAAVADVAKLALKSKLAGSGALSDLPSIARAKAASNTKRSATNSDPMRTPVTPRSPGDLVETLKGTVDGDEPPRTTNCPETSW